MAGAGAGVSTFTSSAAGVSTGAGVSAFTSSAAGAGAGVSTFTSSAAGVSTGAGASAFGGADNSTSITSGSSSTTVGDDSPFISARACSTVIPRALALASADLKSKCSGISTIYYISLEWSRDTPIFSNSPKVNCHENNDNEWEEENVQNIKSK